MDNNPLLDSLLERTSSYINKPKNIDIITRAFFLAEHYHTNQNRKNGEPYITHPVAVAKILADLHSGPDTIAAALLHDTVEDTDLTLKDIEKEFGEDVASMVDGVTKIGKIQFKSTQSQAENQQKMLLAMAKDIRVILIKIADRLHNIRTLDPMPIDRQKAIANETLEIYAPLAHRLGLFRIKAELEDTALKYNDPEMYYYVSGLIQATKSEREHSITNITELISNLLKEHKLEDFEIKGRIKNIHSIYKKMVLQQRDFEDIYDLLAMRIIVDNVANCYQALGIIHANFTPIPKRFKDYIAMPKPNLYQSLHTTVLANDGTLFEVQIRTHEMDEIAEYGIAAHWAYKESVVYSKEREQFEMAQKLKWYADLLKITSDSDDVAESAKVFVDTIKSDILTANVYVFTPKGEVIELTAGATPIDFAYSIHTEVGNKTVGATINNKIAPLNTTLKTGDIVSIKTNKNATPSEDWLKIVKSSHARTKINAYFNKTKKKEFFTIGKRLVDEELAKNHLDFILTDDFVYKNFIKQSCETVEDLLVEVGKNNISSKTVIAKIQGKEVDRELMLKRQMERTSRQLKANPDTGIYVEGLDNAKIKLANCCNPVYGEKILGYISKSAGIIVHRKDCHNLKGIDMNRTIDVFWADEVNIKYPTWIKITGNNQNSLLTDILTRLSSLEISVAEMSASSKGLLGSSVSLKVLVKDINALNHLMVNLKKVVDVYTVERETK